MVFTIATTSEAGNCRWRVSTTSYSSECSQGGEKAKDIVDTAVGAGQFKTLAAALTKAELVETLKGKGPFTVFAPTDKAFSKLPEGTIKSLLQPENREKLAAILTYHVVPGRVMAADVVELKRAKTAQGSELGVRVEGGKVFINDARVMKTDISASNGVIHVVDSVLLPELKDIVDVAVAAGSFETLATAVTEARLVETLKGKGPFTVFAPTDEAFAKLPEGTIASLLQPENREKLTAILTYHVVPGRVLASDVVGLQAAKTVQGGELKIRVEDGKVYINDAQVIKTDVNARNGVIHVIDSVLLPE
jgi:uncharacterized surface protein with fasciclin (FAS1) repeats